MTDVNNSPNFYVGRSADVGDMLLYGQVVSECHAQNFDDGSVTKDQSEWGFTVNQGATTIHEESAAYTVSGSSLTISDGLPQDMTVRPHMLSPTQIQ